MAVRPIHTDQGRERERSNGGRCHFWGATLQFATIGERVSQVSDCLVHAVLQTQLGSYCWSIQPSKQAFSQTKLSTKDPQFVLLPILQLNS